MSRNGLRSTLPSLTIFTTPFFSTTKSRPLPSPAWAIWTGALNPEKYGVRAMEGNPDTTGGDVPPAAPLPMSPLRKATENSREPSRIARITRNTDRMSIDATSRDTCFMSYLRTFLYNFLPKAKRVNAEHISIPFAPLLIVLKAGHILTQWQSLSLCKMTGTHGTAAGLTVTVTAASERRWRAASSSRKTKQEGEDPWTYTP